MSEMPNYHISENATAGIGICVLIVLIAIAVTIFILCGMKTKKYEFMEKEDIETAYGVSGMVKEKRDAYHSMYVTQLVIGIACCICSVIPLFGTLAVSLSRGCSELNIFFKRSFDLPIDTPFILIVSSVIRFSIQLSTQSFVSISVVSNNSEIASPNNFINSCLDSNVFSNNILCPRYAGSNLGEKTLNILDVLFLIADIEDKAKFDNKPLVMSANSSTIKS
mgnify:CR=1 FL=1